MKKGIWGVRDWLEIYGKVEFKWNGMVSKGLKDNILDERYSKDFLEKEKLNAIV